MGTHIRIYCGFLLLVTLAVGWIWYVAVTDGANTELGPWAMRLRLIEILLLAIATVSVLLVLAQLSLNAEQMRQSAKWNKLTSYHQFFGDIITSEMVTNVRGIADACAFNVAMDSITPMTRASADAIELSREFVTGIGSYLDEFEEFCGAVHAGVTDPDYAYSLEATRVIRAWTVFEPLVERWRQRDRYTRCYLELQRLSVTWKARRESEQLKKNDQDGVRPHI